MQLRHEAEQRHDNHDERYTEPRSEHILQQRVSFEFKTGKHIGCGCGNHDDRRAGCERVQKRVHKKHRNPLRAPRFYVIVEMKTAYEFEHVIGENLLRRRKRGEHYPADEDKRKQNPKPYQHVSCSNGIPFSDIRLNHMLFIKFRHRIASPILPCRRF